MSYLKIIPGKNEKIGILYNFNLKYVNILYT